MDTVQESFINKKSLRQINTKSAPGKHNRQRIKITITPETMAMLEKHVKFGRGSYGSPFIELSIRLLVAMIDNGEDLEQVCREIKSVSSSPYLQNNVNLFKELMEK